MKIQTILSAPRQTVTDEDESLYQIDSLPLRPELTKLPYITFFPSSDEPLLCHFMPRLFDVIFYEGNFGNIVAMKGGVSREYLMLQKHFEASHSQTNTDNLLLSYSYESACVKWPQIHFNKILP